MTTINMDTIYPAAYNPSVWPSLLTIVLQYTKKGMKKIATDETKANTYHIA
jgi:hypothetical protein